jgi:hypothetical protein
MFTHNPVTPVRLEILVDLLRSYPRGLPRKEVCRMLQPESLNSDLGNSSPSAVTVSAALELGLAEEEEGDLSLSAACRKRKQDSRLDILAAFDARVLSSVEVEKYFALFYSYYLGLGKQAYVRRSQNKDQWADQFNQALGLENNSQENRFNATKLTGLHRWFNYVGLGWYDPMGEFQANPYDRLLRALPLIFGRQRKLEADEFMPKLSDACPELDGGALFLQANPGWDASAKRCTLGLSHALIELHLDKIIQLHCPADSPGWNIGDAEPPGGNNFKSHRFAVVEQLKD